MAISSLLDTFPPCLLLTTVIFGLILTVLTYRAFFDELRGISGPLICRLTSLWTYYHSYVGDECTLINELHKKYGPVLRIAPGEVCLSDGAASGPVYSEKGGFLKAPCYTNFDIEGHHTIFSALDPSHRAVRSKAVVSMFSMNSVRSGNDVIEDCISQFIARFKEEADDSRKAHKATGQPQPFNVLNLTRSLALDAVCSYLFRSPFGSVDEKSDKMSASSFVDSLVAVGRFFFLPNWLFIALETASTKLFPDKEGDESSAKVDGFVKGIIRGSEEDATTYQRRLLNADISSHEAEIQCKDLMFAGTDSTGMTLGSICWHLAKRPDIYTTLCKEIAEADNSSTSYNPQSLQYLDAVIREGLRIAMANPTRLPRIVPPQGFDFTAASGQRYHLPPGTLVGLQIYTLHFNPEVYLDPFAFKPERWLDNPSAEMQRDWIPFGLGSRQCIARNLATQELFLAVRALARERVLDGIEAVGEKIEILEWCNSRVKGERIDLVCGCKVI